MSELFKIKETKYGLRKGIALVSFNPKTTNYGINSISYLAPDVWDQIPEDIKKCESLSIFKKKVKKWIPKKCPCTLQIVCPKFRICISNFNTQFHSHTCTVIRNTYTSSIDSYSCIHTYRYTRARMRTRT